MNIECDEVFKTDAGHDLVGVMYSGIKGEPGSGVHNINKMKALAEGAVLLREGRFVKPREKGSAKTLAA